MEIDKLSDTWLYQRHSKQTIKEWVNHLKYFYFIRAWGGHANDGDAFKVGINYTDKEDLIFKVGQLGLFFNIIPEDFPRPVIGQSYPSAEFEKFKSEVKRFRELEQPRHSIIFGHKTFIWISDGTIEISIAGTKDENYYEVTEADYKVCLELENKFDTLNWHNLTDKNLEKNVCCISKTKYPELFA